MTTSTAKAAVQYAVVFLVDQTGGEIPQFSSSTGVLSTDSCIVVCCRPDVDGETEFTLGDADVVDCGDRPIFEGLLRTPSFIVTLQNADGDIILNAKVKNATIGVRVWTNDPSEPDRVVFGIFYPNDLVG